MMPSLRPTLFVRLMPKSLLAAVLVLSGVVQLGCSGDERAAPRDNQSLSDAGDAAVDTSKPPLQDPEDRFTAAQLRTIDKLSPLGEPPPDPTNAYADDSDAAHFGQFLFFDEQLSSNGEFSCATCHVPDHAFSDPNPLSEANGTTARHAPTVVNAAFNRWQFWDGRADSLWAQIVEPFENSHEQGITRLEIAHRLYDDPEMKQAYESIFGSLPDLSDTERFPESGMPRPDDQEHEDHVAWSSMSEADQDAINEVLANVGKAIAAYERKLVSGNAPFDAYVRGLETGDEEKLNAISESARRGLELFVGEAECATCHFGPALTDREFHNLGLPNMPGLDPMDLGRYEGIPTVKNDPFNATGPYSDAPDASKAAQEIKFLARTPETRGQFKTPTLRNVERTPPYMHGGHFETLEEVVRFYDELDGQVLVGHREESLQVLNLTDQQVDDLVAFLKSLSGEPIPETLKEQPSSPVPD